MAEMLIKHIAVACAIAALVGCATEPVSSADAVPTKAVLLPELTVKKAGYGSVTFKRDRGLSNIACSFRLYAAGAPFADLSAGQIVTVHLPPGEYIFGAQSNGICFAGNAETQITVKANQSAIYRVSVNAGGAIALQPTAF